MLKKMFFVAILALQFFALSNVSPASAPIPECNPCPFVR